MAKRTSTKTQENRYRQDEASAREPYTLVIVESPAKARTLAGILGPGFKVTATKGHILELTDVDERNGYLPSHAVIDGKHDLLAALQRDAALASKIVLATDDDREGEAIAQDLETLLLHTAAIERVVFHEITPTAITDAFANPRQILAPVVEAQRARQILDKVIGKHLSRALAKAVVGSANNFNYASGRVQLPALALVVGRERLRASFVSTAYNVLTADFLLGGSSHEVTLEKVNGKKLPTANKNFDSAGLPFPGFRLLEDDQANTYVTGLRSAAITAHSPTSIQRTEKPKPPFTTATLQQSASSRLSLSPADTMREAQALYELGLITYVRTDSATLSQAALAATAAEIHALGQKSVPRTSSSASHAQNAHEAIRPSLKSSGAFVSRAEVQSRVGDDVTETQAKLFDLIWRRTVASQMQDCLREHVVVEFSAVVGEDALLLTAKDTVVLALGFRSLWAETSTSGDQIGLALASTGSPCVQVSDVRVSAVTTEPPARLSEASLIKALAALGLGRPSTYAETLRRLKEHNFIRVTTGRAVVPTPRGLLAADAASQFPHLQASQISGPGLTSAMESGLDSVAAGQLTRSAFLFNALGWFDGPGLVTDLRSIAKQARPRRVLTLGSFSCTAMASNGGITTSCGPVDVVLRAGTGKLEDYAFCAGCGKEAALSESYTLADTSPTEVARWVHERASRELGYANGEKVVLRYGSTTPYIVATQENGGRRTVPLPEGWDAGSLTLEDAGTILSAPRVPRCLGVDPASGYEVWLRKSRGAYVVECGPEAGKARSPRAERSQGVLEFSAAGEIGTDISLDSATALIGKQVLQQFGPNTSSKDRPSQEVPVEGCTPSAILQVLRNSPGISARLIAAAIGGTRHAVNVILYRHSDLFVKDDATPPRWWAK